MVGLFWEELDWVHIDDYETKLHPEWEGSPYLWTRAARSSVPMLLASPSVGLDLDEISRVVG